MIDLYLVTGTLNAVTALSLGVLVYLKGRKPLHRYWLLMSICVAAWAFLVGIERILIDQELNLVINRIEQAFAVCIPVLFLHVAMYFAYGSISRQQLVRLKIAYTATLGLVALAPTTLFVKAIAPQAVFDGRPYDVAGPLYFLFPLLYVVLVSYAMGTVLKARRTADAPKRAQLTLFSVAMAIGFLVGGTCFPLVFGVQIPPLGFHVVWLYSLILTYAIFRHHLWDIQLVIRRSLLTAIVVALLVAGYFGLIHAAEQLFKMSFIQHHLLALVSIGTTVLALGVFTLLSGRGMFTSKLFALYMSSIAWWSFSEIWAQYSPGEAAAIIRLRTEYFGVCFIPTLFYHVVVKLTGVQRKAEILTSYVLSMLFTVLIAVLRHPLLLPDAVPVAYLPYWGKAGPLYFTFLLFFGSVVLRALQTLWRVSQVERASLRRIQLRLLFAASLLAYVGGTPEFALKYGIWIPFLSPYGLYLLPLHVVVIAYAIVQFKLFDLHIVIRRSLVYSTLVGSLTIGYFTFIYVLERVYQETFGYQSGWLSLAAFAFMALAFQPLKIGIQRVVDWLFFHAPHEEMVKRMERMEQEVREADKLRAISTLAAGMAHEIKNPLTSLKTFAEYLPERGRDPAFQQKWQRIVSQEVGKIDFIVRRLLEFAKPAPPKLQPIRPSDLLDETLGLLSSECLKRSVEVERRFESNGMIQADPQQLCQVFLNLLLNSLEAMDGTGGKLTVGTAQADGQLVVTIEDTGKGISKEHLEHIFDPFFTTKTNGTGLGLSITRSIITDHRGTLVFDSELYSGTRCTLTFPSCNESKKDDMEDCRTSAALSNRAVVRDDEQETDRNHRPQRRRPRG